MTTKGSTKVNGQGKAPAKAAPSHGMGEAHKAALAAGREQGRHVRRYLQDLETTRPKRGRKRDMTKAKQRLGTVLAELETATGIERVHLAQERLDLNRLLGGEAVAPGADSDELRERFIEVVRPYSVRKGIDYETWRDCGVPQFVLKEGGLTPTRTRAAVRG